MRKKINKDNFTDPYSDYRDFEEEEMSHIYIDPACITDECDSEFDEKYTFEVEYFIRYKIIELLKKPPPSGSYITTEWKESEGSSGNISYAAVYYYYKSNLKSHREYSEKVDNLISSDRYYKSCEKDFKNEFRKYAKNKYRNVFGF